MSTLMFSSLLVMMATIDMPSHAFVSNIHHLNHVALRRSSRPAKNGSMNHSKRYPLQENTAFVKSKLSDEETGVQPTRNGSNRKRRTSRSSTKSSNETKEDELPLKTYQDFKDKFEAIAFLQSMQDSNSQDCQDEEDLCKEAQKLFDQMFEEWYMNEKDDLEPTTEIYNLLIEIYANAHVNANSNSSKIPKQRQHPMTVPEQILQKMEHGDEENVPSPNTKTYITIMNGWANQNDMKKVEGTFERLEQRYELTSDSIVYPTIDAYNALLSLWLKSEQKIAPEKAENILFRLMERGRFNAHANTSTDNNSNNGSSSSTQKSPLEEIHDETNPEIAVESCGPNSKSFYLVMSCFVRDKFLSHSTKISKVNDLLQLMKEWKSQNTLNNTVDPKHKNIANVRIKICQTAIEAEAILFDMIDSYQEDHDECHRPDAAAFINTINAWKHSKSKEAPQRSLELLDLLTEIYQIESESDKNVIDLKPDRRVYNAVQNVWCRSIAQNKAQETKKLLSKLLSLHEQYDDEDYIPSVRQWNNVLNACVYTKGNQQVRKDAMKIMVETFNELRYESTVVAPNHVTYGLFLKGCKNLLPNGEKQQTIIENIFRKCCREGLVSEFVFVALVESTTEEVCQRLFGGNVHNDEGIQIPHEWARNTKSK